MSEHGTLIVWRWDGEAMHPEPRFTALADREFCIGETYRMEAVEDRSWRSHKHQFAEIREAWANLPEWLQDADWAQTPETLRKRALIETGWCDTLTEVCGSEAAARRVATVLGHFARRAHGYAIVSVSGPAVVVKVPRSQSIAAMGAKDFQASKTAVLEWLDGKLGLEPGTLAKQGTAA